MCFAYEHIQCLYMSTFVSAAVSQCQCMPVRLRHINVDTSHEQKRQLMSSLSSATERGSQSPFGHIVRDYPETAEEQ